MANSKNVYISPGGGSFVIWFSQGDVGNTATLSLRGERDYYEVPEGAVVKIAGTKPSGLGFNEIVTYDGHEITITATEDMTDEAGFIECEIAITYDNVRIGSGNGHLGIERNPHPDDITDGTAEHVVDEITALVVRAETAAASIHNLSADAETLAAGSDATVVYDEEENALHFGIPRGYDGFLIEGAIGFTDNNAEGNVVITVTP